MSNFFMIVLKFLLDILKYIPEHFTSNKFFWIFWVIVFAIVTSLSLYFFV